MLSCSLCPAVRRMFRRFIPLLLLSLLSLVLIVGRGWCADGAVSASDDDLYVDLYADEPGFDGIADPLQSVNRAVFWLNDKCYVYLLKPVARGFRVVPEPVRSGLARMFDNLKSPLRSVSCLLQWKVKQSGIELTRLVVNSTLGLAGFYDPAQSWWELRKQDEDLGQVLGAYGVGYGCYLVLPVLGSSSLRDGVALLPQMYTDPLHWTLNSEAMLITKTTEVVNGVSLDRDTYESIIREQLDPYLFIRDAYLQNRAGKVDD
ncbi:MAG: VacJ family lipoprotein [Desulfuromonadaceae bacterium]|nr:VacJ family lipoprotein [Desulfuromonadaceae bacterium]